MTISEINKTACVCTVSANRLPERMASVTKIDFGPRSARDYFGLHVMPANSRFLKISNQENAIAVAKSLWDTTGWLWSDRNPGVDRRDQPAVASAFDEDLVNRCPDLQYMRDLADATKHGGELGRSSVVVNGVSGCGSPGGTLSTSNQFGMMGERASGPFGGMAVQSTPECTLQIDLKDGGSRDMKEALATVFKFLQAETS
jgi:hypothetical protein